jgi:amidase
MSEALRSEASNLDDVLALSALDQARFVREGRISSEELTRAYLERIRRRNPSLNAFVHVSERAALRAARAKDDELRQGAASLPPFHGVPIGIKDLNLVRGSFASFGSRAMKYFWTPVDDRSVSQIRRGGFVVVGKLATSEFGVMPVTEPDIHPPTRNPWNPERTPGGSSGGSGAAVAAGMIPIAHGSDGAGSIRIPSAFCHLYGIKPSRGRVKEPFWRNDRTTLVSCGPLARTVEDAAAMLDVMAGVSAGTRHWAPRPERSFLEAARRPPSRLRIRFTTESVLGVTDAEIVDAVRRVAAMLASLGHEVAEGAPPNGSLDEFLPIWKRLVASVPVIHPSLLQPTTRRLWESGRRIPPAEAARAQAELTERLTEWFGDADIWLTPTVAVLPPPVGRWNGVDPDQAFEQAAVLGAFTALFNVTGQPAASIPAGLSRSGLPMGAQLAGRTHAEATVLALSRQLEQAMPWSGRQPP